MESKLFLWSGNAMFIGSLDQTNFHKHHALQITIGLNEPFILKLKNKQVIESQAVVIAPNTSHAFEGRKEDSLFIYLDPNGHQAQWIIKKVLDGNEKLSLEKSTIRPHLMTLLNSIGTVKNCKDNLISLNQFLENTFGIKKMDYAPDSRVQKTITLIDENISKVVRVKRLAETVHLSESRLIHLFKKHRGLPIRRFILWKRIQLAINSIISGHNITQAAHQAGFSDSAHFSRTFMEMFGVKASEIFNRKNNIKIRNCF